MVFKTDPLHLELVPAQEIEDEHGREPQGSIDPFEDIDLEPNRGSDRCDHGGIEDSTEDGVGGLCTGIGMELSVEGVSFLLIVWWHLICRGFEFIDEVADPPSSTSSLEEGAPVDHAHGLLFVERLLKGRYNGVIPP